MAGFLSSLFNPRRTARLLALGAVVSAGLLAGAHAFETFGGYAPCPLCLDQREAHWTALGVAVAGIVLLRLVPRWSARFGLLAAMTVIYLWSAGLAGYHAGVEYDWWPGPATCSGVSPLDGLTTRDLVASLKNPKNVVPCDEAAWRLFGISMAGYNFLVSLGLAVLFMVGLGRVARGRSTSQSDSSAVANGL